MSKMDKSGDFYSECVKNFSEIVKKPSHFLQTDGNVCSDVKHNLKNLYDFTKKEEIKSVKSNALPELVVQNFDLEQIWQQLELQNETIITDLVEKASKLVVGKSRLLFKNFENELEKTKESEERDEEVEEGDDNLSEELDDDLVEEGKNEEELSVAQSEDKESDNEETKKNKKSIVDDDFFKLEEMEQFLKTEEKKLNEPDSGNDSEESDEGESEASVNLFEADSGDESDDARMAKYKDFFGQKDKNQKKVTEEPQSSFELRQSRLNEKISEIEETAIEEKPWQLKGEITGEKRPQNSLLEEVVEFDLTTRPAPIITEQTTMQLEDIIKQRIKDRAFDSVERKEKPVETVLEYKKKLVLDQEKSKESLSQIYEKEFIEQQAALDPDNQDRDQKEPELHQEINKMMKELFVKLDALSNFHFTPKPAIPDIKIISNLPAISIEEVAPIATSDATLLAPEEVKPKPKGDIIGKGERTTTDKKRERRKKKRKQKIHALEKQKKEAMVLKKNNKKGIKKTLQKVIKEKNVDKMDETLGDASVKSSKAFFTQLQEQVRIQNKRKSIDKKKENLNAKKLKL